MFLSIAVPNYAAKNIYRWAQDQDWPEGTELEDPKDYHCTLASAEEGSYNENAWWLPDEESIYAKIADLDNFGPNGSGKYAYVLRLEGPDLQELGEKTLNMAESWGIPVKRFGGEFKPHITVGYGPMPVQKDAPNIELHLGPTEHEEYEDPHATPSLEKVARSLKSVDPWEATLALTKAGYPSDHMTIMAVLDTKVIIKNDDKVPDWDWESTIVEPFPDDNWDDYKGNGSEQHHDVQFSNDTSDLH